MKNPLPKLPENEIFKVTFIKRTDGTIRTMLCRLNVKKDLKGEEREFDPKKKNLLCVFDMAKQDYRFINLEAILRIKVGGIEYILNDAEKMITYTFTDGVSVEAVSEEKAKEAYKRVTGRYPKVEVKDA